MVMPFHEPARAGPMNPEPGYRTKQQRIRVAGVDDLLIRSLFDRCEYFDPLGDAERMGISPASWPLFGLLWPAGEHLAARLARRPVRAGERILEIGCGLALASLVGHRLGADVTASDCHPLAEAFLLENLRLNALEPIKFRHGRWSDGPQPARRDGAPAQCVLQGRYDLIIGSDLLYERDQGGTLAAFIEHHSAAAGEVWIVDPDRGNRPAFNRQMGAQGFRFSEERFARPDSGRDDACKGRVLSYRRPGVARL
jgi:predicted nicotinamide N-methyase